MIWISNIGWLKWFCLTKYFEIIKTSYHYYFDRFDYLFNHLKTIIHIASVFQFACQICGWFFTFCVMNGSVYFHILINFGTCFSKLISWKKRCSTKVDHKTCYKILVKQGSGFVIVNSYKKYMYFQIRFKRDVKL